MARGRRIALIAVVTVGVLIGIPAVVGGLGRSGLTEARGTVDCRADPAATTADYLLGLACPPAGFARAFGYEPLLVETSEGWRYTRPAWSGAECNGPIGDKGPFWDFGALCRTHDYGYDLVRFGIGDRGEADQLLYEDMLAGCADQGPVGAMGCQAIAGWARAVLKVGDVLGFDPEILPGL